MNAQPSPGKYAEVNLPGGQGDYIGELTTLKDDTKKFPALKL